jgi:lysylphosphatidylglycerol synthetase-like protein (DUF2156 family)
MQEHEEVTKMDQVERLMQRPLLYNNIDGVGELALGFFFLGYVLIQRLPFHSSIWRRYGVLLGFLLLIAAIHYGVKAIKKHITYPRTGFVEYQKRGYIWKGAIAGAVVGLFFGLILVLAARSHWKIGPSHWILTTPAALIGLVLTAGYAYKIAKAVRWKWAVAAAMAISSVAIAMIPEGVIGAAVGRRSAAVTTHEWIFGALLLTFAFYGAILLISGGISFVLYLRHTQPAAETEE